MPLSITIDAKKLCVHSANSNFARIFIKTIRGGSNQIRLVQNWSLQNGHTAF